MQSLKKGLLLSLILTLGILSNRAEAQVGRKNLSGFDNKTFHFGFIISGNKSDFSFSFNPLLFFPFMPPPGKTKYPNQLDSRIF